MAAMAAFLAHKDRIDAYLKELTDYSASFFGVTLRSATGGRNLATLDAVQAHVNARVFMRGEYAKEEAGHA